MFQFKVISLVCSKKHIWKKFCCLQVQPYSINKTDVEHFTLCLVTFPRTIGLQANHSCCIKDFNIKIMGLDPVPLVLTFFLCTRDVTRTLTGADPGGGPGGPGPPLTTKNEAPAPKFYKTEAPEWQF